MSSLDADVIVNFYAQDNASPVIDNSVKNIDRSFVQMRNGMRANERSFYLQHQSIFKLNQVMGNLRTITGAGINIMNTMLLTQIRNQAAAKNLRDALRDQSDAFAEFGPNSREFTDAQERVNEVIKEQKDQVLQDTIAWVQMGLYLTSTILPILIKIGSRMRGINKIPSMGAGGSTPSSTITPGAGTAGKGSGRFGGLRGGILGSIITGGLIAGGLAYDYFTNPSNENSPPLNKLPICVPNSTNVLVAKLFNISAIGVNAAAVPAAEAFKLFILSCNFSISSAVLPAPIDINK